MLRFASLFSFSPCILPCVLPSLHWAKDVFLKILTFVKSFVNQHFQKINKNILKISSKKFVSIKSFCNFTTENESKNINLKIYIMELIKIVNYGKAGTYLYAAIVKIENKYFWTETIYCKNKEDKKKIDWHKQKIQKELNEFSLNKYQLK